MGGHDRVEGGGEEGERGREGGGGEVDERGGDWGCFGVYVTHYPSRHPTFYSRFFVALELEC